VCLYLDKHTGLSVFIVFFSVKCPRVILVTAKKNGILKVVDPPINLTSNLNV